MASTDGQPTSTDQPKPVTEADKKQLLHGVYTGTGPITVYRGIDLGAYQYFIEFGKKRWQINPVAHLHKARKELRAAANIYKIPADKYTEQGPKSGITDDQLEEFNEKATIAVLKIALPSLNYEEEANNEACGPVMLDKIAGQLYNFLVVFGGREGFLEYERLSSAATQNS